jgi:hypothetical protein
MMREEISEARTKKLRTNRKMPRRRWRVQMQRLMSNRRPIRRAECDGVPLPPLRARFPSRHPPRVISFNGSLEYTRNQHLRRRRRRRAVAEQRDESPVSNTAARVGSLAYDRSTSSLL